MKMFFVAGIGLAIFIEFLLLSKKKKSAADQVLILELGYLWPDCGGYWKRYSYA